MSVECSATFPIYPISLPQCSGTKRGQKDCKRQKLRTRVKPCLLDTAGPVHAWTRQHGCLHKTWARSSRSPFLLRVGWGLRNSSCSQGTNGIWRLQEAQFSLGPHLAPVEALITMSIWEAQTGLSGLSKKLYVWHSQIRKALKKEPLPYINVIIGNTFHTLSSWHTNSLRHIISSFYNVYYNYIICPKSANKQWSQNGFPGSLDQRPHSSTVYCSSLA